MRLPPGFEITEFAGDTLANDIIRMTLDPRGRVVVSGRGYVRILVDDNNDGRADRAIDLIAPKDGAQGLLWEGPWLYYVAEGGVRRVRIQGDKAVGSSELIRALKSGGEHDTHELRRGPDGWLYVLCGNNAGVNASFAQTPTSPIKEPIAGCVLRFSPDLKKSEIVADGFRNPYGMDFNPDGELFTYEADNERCVSLPWYEPTRLYQVVPGGHYGWRNPQRADFFRPPPYLPDVQPALVNLGRGSPTGVVCYRHAQFPKEYRGGLFLLDWTFGQIHFVPLEGSGGFYTAGKPETFLQATGDLGFAPTDAVVHPNTGDLYVCIGGRGTRGAVYRIRHPAGFKKLDRKEVARLQPKARKPAMAPRPQEPWPLETAVQSIADREAPTPVRLRGVRACQLILGDMTSRQLRGTVFEGYSPGKELTTLPAEQVQQMTKVLRESFPTNDPDLNRELSRTLAMLEAEDAGLLPKLAQRWTEDSDPVEDIHYLIVFARARASRTPSLTRKTAATLLDLDRKLTERKLHRDTNWPLRMAELHAELAKKDPALNAALVSNPTFGRPDHALFARCAGFDRRKAAEIFLAHADKDSEFTWNTDLIDLLGSVPAERAYPVLRQIWEKAGLQENILAVLARRPEAADQARFLEGLASPRVVTVEHCLSALEKLPPAKELGQWLTLIQALRRLPDGKEAAGVRERLVRYLVQATEQKSLGSDKDAWTLWFSKSYPDLAKRLLGVDGVDVEAWKTRLTKLSWVTGDAERGKLVFTKASCAACHSGSQAMGPDLHGVTGRFSRDDLFTAILQPSKDIASRYRTLFVATSDGKVYQGLVVYEAVDSMILQTGASTTVRLVTSQITTRRVTDTSLMPAGLLDRLTNQEIVDLYSYLKSLSVSRDPKGSG